jgi:hypothetical protein
LSPCPLSVLPSSIDRCYRYFSQPKWIQPVPNEYLVFLQPALFP